MFDGKKRETSYCLRCPLAMKLRFYKIRNIDLNGIDGNDRYDSHGYSWSAVGRFTDRIRNEEYSSSKPTLPVGISRKFVHSTLPQLYE